MSVFYRQQKKDNPTIDTVPLTYLADANDLIQTNKGIYFSFETKPYNLTDTAYSQKLKDPYTILNST